MQPENISADLFLSKSVSNFTAPLAFTLYSFLDYNLIYIYLNLYFTPVPNFITFFLFSKGLNCMKLGYINKLVRLALPF